MFLWYISDSNDVYNAYVVVSRNKIISLVFYSLIVSSFVQEILQNRIVCLCSYFMFIFSLLEVSQIEFSRLNVVVIVGANGPIVAIVVNDPIVVNLNGLIVIADDPIVVNLNGLAVIANDPIVVNLNGLAVIANDPIVVNLNDLIVIVDDPIAVILSGLIVLANAPIFVTLMKQVAVLVKDRIAVNLTDPAGMIM